MVDVRVRSETRFLRSNEARYEITVGTVGDPQTSVDTEDDLKLELVRVVVPTTNLANSAAVVSD